MSAFLGPIHTWLFTKIKFQDELVTKIEKLATEKNWIKDSLHGNPYSPLETGELADIIDQSNIHGWLQERVSLVENKLAYLVTVLTKEHPDRISEISRIAYEFGKDYAYTGKKEAKETYAYLETLLLNGMPCDRVNEMIKQDENEVLWRQVQDIHKSYWMMVDGNSDYYNTIRKNIINGILENSDLEFSYKESQIYQIRKAV